ncbi:hypothetical protein [Soonwooa sp.]|uniref:hypothetical protein n=1 Tax=Soonwooa sp. TaxID=1938592 RepID=UPI0028B07350|nr:hypothetical protein [Soonwooa sp.]
MYWTYIFNPLAKILSKAFMLIGLISGVIGSFISQFYFTIYDGLIDAHTYYLLTYAQAITANMITIILPCILLFILGRIINPKTRMIDILNTSFLYRIPIYVFPFFTNLPAMKSIEAKINDPSIGIRNIQFSPDETGTIVWVSILSIALITYAITLMFFGFKTATNAKKTWHYIAFAGVFIIGEILSKIIIRSIL